MNIENKQLIVNLIMLVNIILIVWFVSGYMNLIEYDIYMKNTNPILKDEEILKFINGEEIIREKISISPVLLLLIMIQIVLIIENLFNLTKFFNMIEENDK